MEEPLETNYAMRFSIRDAYYPQTRMNWHLKSLLLYTELFSEWPEPQSVAGVGIDADNIDQLALDLSAFLEIKYIECIGFRFEIDDQITVPFPTRQGNLVLSNPPHGIRYGEDRGDNLPGVWSLGCSLELTCTQERKLLKIGIDKQTITNVVAASDHVLYGLAGDALQSIWLINPAVSNE